MSKNALEKEPLTRYPHLCWVRGLRGPEVQLVYGDEAGPYKNEYLREHLIHSRPMKDEYRGQSLDYLAQLYPCPVQPDCNPGCRLFI